MTQFTIPGTYDLLLTNLKTYKKKKLKNLKIPFYRLQYGEQNTLVIRTTIFGK